MVLATETFVADKKVPTIISHIRTQLLKTEERPTLDNDSYELEDGMVSMVELKAALALISKTVRDLR